MAASNQTSREEIFLALENGINQVSSKEIFLALENGTFSNDNLSRLNISSGISGYPVAIPFSTRICVWALTSVSGIGIIGNLFVLIICLKNLWNITHFKFLIGHLAFCDFLFSFTQIFNVAGNGWYTGKSIAWMFNSKLCKLSRGSTHLGSLVSVGSILAIAAERFIGIRKSMSSNTANIWKKVMAGVCLIWIIAFSSAIPIFMSTRLVNNECKEWNDYFAEEWIKIYSIYLLLVFCLFPMAAMSLMNGMVILELKKHVQSCIPFDNKLGNVPQSRKGRDMLNIKILITIITAFFVCTLPTKIMFVATIFFEQENLKMIDTYSIVKLLDSFHVAVNPLIYGIMDKAFRNQLIEILFCCECEEAENEESSLIISEQSNCSVDSLKECIRDKTSELGTYNLLTAPINPKDTLMLFEQHQKAKDESNCFQKERYV